MRTEAEVQDALSSFERAVSLRLHEVESLNADDRLYLVKLSKLHKQVADLRTKIKGLEWILE